MLLFCREVEQEKKAVPPRFIYAFVGMYPQGTMGVLKSCTSSSWAKGKQPSVNSSWVDNILTRVHQRMCPRVLTKVLPSVQVGAERVDGGCS